MQECYHLHIVAAPVTCFHGLFSEVTGGAAEKWDVASNSRNVGSAAAPADTFTSAVIPRLLIRPQTPVILQVDLLPCRAAFPITHLPGRPNPNVCI